MFGKWQVRVQDGSKRCHCERSEAISALQKGDCFVATLLRMTLTLIIHIYFLPVKNHEYITDSLFN